jgi:Spore Coat Protein U domain
VNIDIIKKRARIILKMKKFLPLLLILPFLAYAGTVTTTLTSTAKLEPTCSFSTQDANFGVIDSNKPGVGIGIAYSVTVNVSVLCNNKTPYTVSGMPYIKDGPYTSQYMSGTGGNTDKLSYGIWTNPSFTQWFADGKAYGYGTIGQSTTTSVISGSGTGTINQHPLYVGLYAQVGTYGYPQRWVKPDIYMDNYTLTLNF